MAIRPPSGDFVRKSLPGGGGGGGKSGGLPFDPFSAIGGLPSFTGGAAESSSDGFFDTSIAFNNPFTVGGGASNPVSETAGQLLPVAALMVVAWAAVKIFAK